VTLAVRVGGALHLGDAVADAAAAASHNVHAPVRS